MQYNIRWAKPALKALNKMSIVDKEAIRRKMFQIAADPYTSHTNVKTLMGGKNGLYRLRHGNWRILYSVDNGELLILVVDIGHRKEVYK